MNPETGEVKLLMSGEKPPEGFVPVPRRLRKEAEKSGGRVHLRDDSRLAKFAAKKRRKAARVSRRKNRKR